MAYTKIKFVRKIGPTSARVSGFLLTITPLRPFVIDLKSYNYEPRHDKTNVISLRPALIQTRLRIRPV
jgi:hypothetical protein